MTSRHIHQSEPRRGLTFTLLALSTLTIMVGAAIAPALPQVSANLQMQNYASLLLTVPALGVVLAAPIVGVLLLRFGGRITVLAGLILYGGLGMAGAFITSAPVMLTDRFALGVSTAMVMAGGTSLIAELYCGDSRLKMIAKQGMAIELGGVVFLSIGGGLALFHCKLPFGLYGAAWIIFFAVWFCVPKNKKSKETNKLKTRSPMGHMMDLYITAISSMLIFFAAFVTLPHVLHAQGYSEVQTGLYLAFVSITAVTFAGLMPRLRRKLSARIIFILAFASYTLAHMAFAFWLGFLVFIIAAILLGIGFGFTIPLTNYELIERSDVNSRARNLAYLSSAIFLGQFLSSALDVLPQSYLSAFHIAMILSVFSLIWMLIRKAEPQSGYLDSA